MKIRYFIATLLCSGLVLSVDLYASKSGKRAAKKRIQAQEAHVDQEQPRIPYFEQQIVEIDDDQPIDFGDLQIHNPLNIEQRAIILSITKDVLTGTAQIALVGTVLLAKLGYTLPGGINLDQLRIIIEQALPILRHHNLLELPFQDLNVRTIFF